MRGSEAGSIRHRSTAKSEDKGLQALGDFYKYLKFSALFKKIFDLNFCLKTCF